MNRASGQPRYLTGIAGWSYDDWKGWFYPEQRLAGGQLRYVARYFDLAEINSSFYRPPAPRDAERWADCTDEVPGFRFSAKLWRRFTHDRERPWDAGEVRMVRDGLRPLADAERLCGVLAQFPWSFINIAANRDWIARVADEFSDFPLFVEVRHTSWNRPEFYSWLKERRVGFVNIDQPLLRHCLPATSIATTDTAYFRLHGRNRDTWFADGLPAYERYNYLYDDKELREIVGKIREIADQAQTTLVITNNHYRGQAPTNALQLRYRLTGKRPPAPDVLVERYPQLECVTQTPSDEPDEPGDAGPSQLTLFG
jgi:uncharacterized protein YecE (DUF72 family)